MDTFNVKIVLASLALGVAAGALLERHFAPEPNTVTITKEVIKDHIVTVEHTIVRPDGTKDTVATTTSDVLETKNGTALVSSKPAKYMLGAGYGLVGGAYEANAAYRIVGPVWLGASANTNKELFIRLSVEF